MTDDKNEKNDDFADEIFDLWLIDQSMSEEKQKEKDRREFNACLDHLIRILLIISIICILLLKLLS